MPLLEVADLFSSFRTEDGVVRAVNGVSFTVERGETLGIVGESGSGKSVTCLTLLGLLPRRGASVSGRALFNGKDLLAMSPSRLRRVRGSEIAMIFQDPMTSLNPVRTVGSQLVEGILLHNRQPRRAAWMRSTANLAAVGIPNAEARMHSYAHEMSGGMRQRVMIAMALSNEPDLLIADEPTTALDVTTQAQIFRLMRRLRSERGMAVILVTHDLGVVAEMCDKVLVMYAGRVIESGSVDSIFENPSHPYTWGLLGSMPRRNAGARRLRAIAGSPPSMLNPPTGCPFHPRCSFAMEVCRENPPPLLQVPQDVTVHVAACHLEPSLRDAEAKRLVAEEKAQIAL
jgi:oligopeptide/dipeptide ABC transporter ATP-binding protein